MAKNPIVFIMDDSIAYLNKKVDEIVKSWNIKKQNVLTSDEYKHLGKVTTLFQEKQIQHLHFTDANKLKKFNDSIKKEKIFTTDKWYGHGIIITSTKATSIKHITDLVNKYNGEVHKKQKPQQLKKELLEKYPLSNDIKSVLSSFAGEEHDKILAIDQTLLSMTNEDIKKLTVEDVFNIIPNNPGSVLPWEFMNDFFALNVDKTMESIDRYKAGSVNEILIPFITLKKKIELIYKACILRESGIRNNNDLANHLGLKSTFMLKDISNFYTKINVDTAKYIYELTYDTEDKLKGGIRVDSTTVFKNYLVKVILAVKLNKALENLKGGFKKFG